MIAPVTGPSAPQLPGSDEDSRSATDGEPRLPPPVPDSVRGKVDLAIQALDLFDDSSIAVSAGGETPDDSAPASFNARPLEPSWDIEVRSFVTHERVDRYIQLFTGTARDRFSTWLQRGRAYEPMIRSTFRARGVPEDMYYLAAVESGYDPHAVSRAYAVGMWQFMTATARGFGLRVDWWLDERRDPMKATDAAARFLASLKDQFGSFYLAAAAYNGGPGRVKRGLARHADDMEESSGEDSFFALAETGYLRTETLNYVPQLIAAAYIGKDPLRFGIALDSSPPYVYDSLRVPPSTALAAVARSAGTPLARIRELNPFILRGLTPPADSIYVRVPLGTAIGAESVFVTLPDSERIALRPHKAKKGDTMARIASANAISVHQLAWYNPRLKTGKRGTLTAGQVVQVPTADVVLAAFDVPDPAIERYGSSVRGARTHVVRRGETLGGIARRYGTSVNTLAKLNGLKRHVIYAGQTIVVSGSSSRSATRKASSASAKSRVSAKKSSTSTRKATPQSRKTAAPTGKAASSR